MSRRDDEVNFYLSDFGLTDKQRGGTPIFASPESLDGTIVGKSDIYSLGVTWFFVIMHNCRHFLKFLFWPIEDDDTNMGSFYYFEETLTGLPYQARQAISRIPLLLLIWRMILGLDMISRFYSLVWPNV